MSEATQFNPQHLRKALQTATGRGVRIGLLDTGVDSTHPAFRGARVFHHEVLQGLFSHRVVPTAIGRDYGEHGTACAGILQRAAPGAEIHSVAVMTAPDGDKLSRLLTGLEFAIDQGWEVLNLSLGTRKESARLEALIEQALSAGTTILAAKDNEPGYIGFPAALPGVLAVDMEHFESPEAFTFDPKATVQLHARGIYVEAPRAGGGVELWTGASYACPEMAGLCARLREVYPDLTLEMLSQGLMALAKPSQT